jgi:tetratricopeptide (TPR) repeat protein
MKHSMLTLLIAAVLLAGSVSAGPEDTAVDSSAVEENSSDRAITILLTELERKLENVEGAETQDLVGALSIARGYMQLGLHDVAAAWYERLEDLEGSDLFGDAIFNGRLEMAAGSGDPDSLAAIIQEYGASVDDPDETLLVEAITSVGRNVGWKEVGSLVKASLTLYGDKVPGDLLFMQGRALRRENRLLEAVYHFERQLNAMKVPDAVHPSLLSQRNRFIRAAADCSFLMNDRLRARGFYQQLIEEGDDYHREWGRFQVAQIDMLANDYVGAGRVFREIAADSLGTLAEIWAQSLAEHCQEMRAHRQYYVTSSPRRKAAMP